MELENQKTSVSDDKTTVVDFKEVDTQEKVKEEKSGIEWYEAQDQKTKSEFDKAIQKALKTNSENLRKQWEEEEKAKLEKLEAEKKGEFEKLYKEADEKYNGIAGQFTEYEDFVKARFEEAVKDLPENLQKFIPDGSYISKLGYVEELKAQIAEVKKPGSTGGEEIGKVGMVQGTTLSKEQVMALTNDQIKSLSKEDRKKYADLYGFSVFNRK